MLKRRLLGSGLLLTGALCASFAGARQVTPINGNPAVGADASCFQFADGANPARLTQTCSGTRDWLIDAPMDIGSTAGNRSGELWGRGNGSLITTCYMDSANVLGQTEEGSAGAWVVGERGSASWGRIAWDGTGNTFSVWVPSNGTLHAYCVIPQNGGLSGLKFAH
jgi:hypothetical protein